MTSREYKDLSKKEFTKAAKSYESKHAGVYNICREDYPDIVDEVKNEDFDILIDVGCGTGPVISLLASIYPDKKFIGLDLTEKMIDVASSKKIPNAEFVVGDAEDLPFKENYADCIICSESFHHYPNPTKFFESVYKVLKLNGRLILRDYCCGGLLNFLVNHIEMPLCHLAGHGDVGVYTKSELEKMITDSNLKLESFKSLHMGKMQAVIRKE